MVLTQDVNHEYDTIRDVILTCVRKPTRVGLVYRAEPTTEQWRTERRKTNKSIMLRSIRKQPGQCAEPDSRHFLQLLLHFETWHIDAVKDCRKYFAIAELFLRKGSTSSRQNLKKNRNKTNKKTRWFHLLVMSQRPQRPRSIHCRSVARGQVPVRSPVVTHALTLGGGQVAPFLCRDPWFNPLLTALGQPPDSSRPVHIQPLPLLPRLPRPFPTVFPL